MLQASHHHGGTSLDYLQHIHVSLVPGDRTGTRAWHVSSPVLSRGKGLPPMISWQHSYWCSPGRCWFSLPWLRSASSQTTKCLDVHHDPKFLLCFQAGGPNTQWHTFCQRCRNLQFSLVSFKMFLSAQFSNLLRSLQITAWLSDLSPTHPRFVLYTNLLRVHVVPSSTALMRMSHSTGPSTNLWCLASPCLTPFSQVSYLTPACFQCKFLEAGSYTLQRNLYRWGIFWLQYMHLQNLSLTTESKQYIITWLWQDVSL